jgi:hypothetical protein
MGSVGAIDSQPVKVFLSWSGEKSRRVANVFRDWFPTVIQAIEPWLSSSDLVAGVRWNEALQAELSRAGAGVICVTRSNQQSAWLNFEAGLLTKALGPGRVIPVLINVAPEDLAPPLRSVQAAKLDRSGISNLFRTLVRLADPERPIELSERRLEEILIALRLAVADMPELLSDSATAVDELTVSRADEGPLSALESKVDKLAATIELLKDRIIVGHAPGPSLQTFDVPSDRRPTMFIAP